ncbi:MAG: hypothetical protein PHV39_07445, partial [Methanomicrobium sp.]|nr:hypothetical protein [Methanomicrobium sp.]
MKFKHIILISMILLILTATASADKVIPTSTKVFFEKNGVPYNEPVKYTVHCYGYMVDATDPNYKNYWRGTYERKEPGTYEQTEVFSYSATVSNYGLKIYEPFYLNYRVIDYCTLEGETNGIKFAIENVSKSPLPDCSLRENWSFKPCSDQDTCLAETDEFKKCREKQREVIKKIRDSCQIFIEKYDGNNTYSKNGTMMSNESGIWVLTQKYHSCIEEAAQINYNCSQYYESVPCKDYCDPNLNPIMRDCTLYFTIPADENGDIISPIPELKQEKAKTTNQPTLKETLSAENDSLFTELYKFLK